MWHEVWTNLRKYWFWENDSQASKTWHKIIYFTTIKKYMSWANEIYIVSWRKIQKQWHWSMVNTTLSPHRYKYVSFIPPSLLRHHDSYSYNGFQNIWIAHSFSIIIRFDKFTLIAGTYRCEWCRHMFAMSQIRFHAMFKDQLYIILLQQIHYLTQIHFKEAHRHFMK